MNSSAMDSGIHVIGINSSNSYRKRREPVQPTPPSSRPRAHMQTARLPYPATGCLKIFSSHKPGDELTMVVQRDVRKRNVSIRLQQAKKLSVIGS